MFRATLIDVAIQNGTKIKLKEQKMKTEKNKSTILHESKRKTSERNDNNRRIDWSSTENGHFDEKCKSRIKCRRDASVSVRTSSVERKIDEVFSTYNSIE